jgi:DNA-directed RNA polymerase subunit F
MSEPRYVTLAEVKEMLNSETEKRGEILRFQESARAHANEICRLTPEEAAELVDKLKQIDFMAQASDSVPYKIADLLPRYPNDVRAIFSKERVTLDGDMVQAVLDTVAPYLRRCSPWKNT